MTTETEAAVRMVIDEGRRRLGGAPTVEQLAAYQRGDLSEEEEDRIQELLAHYPDSVRLLEALASHPYAGQPGDPDYLTDAELEHDWQAIRDRLHTAAPVVSMEERRSQLVLPLLPAVAASLLIVALGGAGLYYNAGRVSTLRAQIRELQEPKVAPQKRLLIPDGMRTGRGRPSAIRLQSDAEHFLLTLSVLDKTQFPDYRLNILDMTASDSEPLWSKSGLRREPDHTFDLWLPRAFLPPGPYRFHLYGVGDGEDVPLATYTVEF